MTTYNATAEEARAFLSVEKTAIVVPMEPQPVKDADNMWVWEDCQWMDGGIGFPKSGIEDWAPFQPGRRVAVKEPWNILAATAHRRTGWVYEADGIKGVWNPAETMPDGVERMWFEVEKVEVTRIGNYPGQPPVENPWVWYVTGKVSMTPEEE